MIKLEDTLKFTDEEKLKLFNAIITSEILRNKVQKYATPLCNDHIINLIRELAVSEGIIACPFCGCKNKK